MAEFDQNSYQQKNMTLEGRTVAFRAYMDVCYVRNPVDEQYQSMNIFIPMAYYEGGSIHGYDAASAPVFVPNEVGGYLPGERTVPGLIAKGPDTGKVNTLFRALEHGYVAVSPSIRGRTLQAADGSYTGKAPALIVDMKAAIRFLRHLGDRIPGDKEKIITNGTSAGGALSALAGATGNDPAYKSELEKIGAWEERDDIFAASCYCPITDLDHADMAYEWEFGDCMDFHRMNMSMGEGGRPSFTPVDGVMSEKQQRMSGELRAAYPAYLNSLGLKDGNGNPVTLHADGSGSFREYVEKKILASAQTALDRGLDLSGQSWLTVSDGKAQSMSFSEYAGYITRMKCAPAFDSDRMDSPENHEFGTAFENYLHFTSYAAAQDSDGGKLAAEEAVCLMNPLVSLRGGNSSPAKYWRIRVGERDRDTSHAVSAILALSLEMAGCQADLAYPWDIPHAGDYDLPELFDWIDGICKEK